MVLSFEILFLLMILGFMFGVIATISGVGGGVFYVSFITLFFLKPINEAIDTSIYIILITSGAGFIIYLKEKRTNIKLSLIFSGFSILGSILCTIFLLFIHFENYILKLMFASVLLLMGIHMLQKAIKSRKKEKTNTLHENQDFSLKDYDYRHNLKRGIPLFMLAGFTSYLLGIGGGVINTPVLNIILGFPIHNSTAISTSIIFFTAIYNVIAKIFLGEIDYIIGTLIGIGTILGSIFGAKISKRMPKVLLQFFVAIVLIGLAINMYF